jgi:RNA polymerase primary sigma factor
VWLKTDDFDQCVVFKQQGRETIMNEEQQSQLKQLIAKGKECGYLTYQEINDHLPDEIVDPEQIENIVGMINDMGIAVHEEAPDVDALLMSDATPVVADEDVAEEAAAALVSVDSEFGRTTDPVRMYMREMGCVDLLTREGEIKIAKRIEEGLSQALSALATYPDIIGDFLKLYDSIETEEIKLSDLISGFVDPEAQHEEVTAEELDSLALDELSEEELFVAEGEENPPILGDTLDPEETKQRFEALRTIYTKLMTVRDKKGQNAPDFIRLRHELAECFLQFKLVPKVIDDLSVKLREAITIIREQENTIREVLA